jgi:perosamine synthetase
MVPRPHKSSALQAQRLQPMNIAAEAISRRFCADLPNEIARRLDAMFPHRDANIALHEPEFNNQAETLVLDCLRSTYVSSVGEYVQDFETELAAACGVKHAVAMVNGTAALEVALRVVGVEPGSEVLLPSLTFVATANAVSHLNAVPHFVDVEDRSLGIDSDALVRHLKKIGRQTSEGLFNKETGRRISAIIPVHVFGHPVAMDDLNAVANSFDLPVIEDAAEALGSQYKLKHCGSLGQAGAFSFNGNKILTTGGGGAVVTNDSKIADLARHLSSTAKLVHPWEFEHDSVGYNYRMPNLNAALGVSQLMDLETRIASKRTLGAAYESAFSDQPGLRVLTEPSYATSNYWLNAIILDSAAVGCRDAVLKKLHKLGFMARPIWKPMHKQVMYADAPRAKLPITEDFAGRIINLPSSAHLKDLLQ